jgi:hypothetical protein
MNLVDLHKSSGGGTAHLTALETGNILRFNRTPFEISSVDRDALLSAGQADGNFHKNIAYRPLTGKLTGLGKAAPGEEEQVTRAITNYSRQAIQLLGEVLAPYAKSWKTDYASFRSIEEEGRSLPLKKRNDLLHTDAFPTRPTNGGLILRIFTNINPSKERAWMTTDPFEKLAERYAMEAGLKNIAAEARSPWRRLVSRAIRARSPYDKFMLGFHDFLKSNAQFQRDCEKYRFSFAPGSTWIVFTDVVPHAVLSGRYALEQTMIISRDTLAERGHAPASILEKLSGTKLTM